MVHFSRISIHLSKALPTAAMKCHQRFTFFSFLPTFANILVIVAIVFAQPRRIPTKKPEYLSEPRKLKFQLDIKKGCDYISFPNATINDCGYCVGGATGLEANFGKDCLGGKSFYKVLVNWTIHHSPSFASLLWPCYSRLSRRV